jgi:predicted transcriptional regulator
MTDPAVEAEITSRLQDKKGGQTVDELQQSVKRPKEVILHALEGLRERGLIALKEGV